MPSPFFLGPYTKAGVFVIIFEHETKQNNNEKSTAKLVTNLQFSGITLQKMNVEIHKIPTPTESNFIAWFIWNTEIRVSVAIHCYER